MKRDLLHRVLAAMLLITGTALCLQAVRETRPAVRRIKRKLADLETLRSLEASYADDRAALAVFEDLPAKTPRRVTELIGRLEIEDDPNIRRRDASAAAAGWNLANITVSFDSVDLSTLSRFIKLATADTERPPWMVTELNVSALEGNPGRGRASLTLEALEKSSETR